MKCSVSRTRLVVMVWFYASFERSQTVCSKTSLASFPDTCLPPRQLLMGRWLAQDFQVCVGLEIKLLLGLTVSRIYSFPMGTALKQGSVGWLAFQNFGKRSLQEHHQILSWQSSLSGSVHLLRQHHLPEVWLCFAPVPFPGWLTVPYTARETSRTRVHISEAWMCF